MGITKEHFDEKEVRPMRSGWYLVTLYQFSPEKPEDPKYFDDWLEYDLEEEAWDYEEYEGTCYVCFIQKKEERWN